MDLSFNKAGKIVAWTGAPIHLVNTTTPDTAMFNEIKEWRQPFDAYGNQVIGHSDSLLDQTICQTVECNIGDFIADATLAYRRNVSEGVDLCILNAGGAFSFTSFHCFTLFVHATTL
jgi:5'-nucleotidase